MVPSPHTAAWALSLSCHKLNMILDKYCCVLCHTENKSVSLYYFFKINTVDLFFFILAFLHNFLISNPPSFHPNSSLGSDRIRVDRVCHCMATRLQWLPELYLLFLDQPELPEKISPGPPEVDCVLVS